MLSNQPRGIREYSPAKERVTWYLTCGFDIKVIDDKLSKQTV